jgi:hypothetical protein
MLLTSTHRRQTVAGAAVRAYAEAVETGMAASPSKYTGCGTAAAYQTAFSGYSPPSGYAAKVNSVEYWTGTGFSTSCGTDQGVQRITLQVASSDNKVTGKLAIVVRKPCRSTIDFPADPACS